MNDEVEIIPIQIPCAIYERKIVTLIENLLLVDEILFGAESEAEVEKAA